jgi:hypothetical protein
VFDPSDPLPARQGPAAPDLQDVCVVPRAIHVLTLSESRDADVIGAVSHEQ